MRQWRKYVTVDIRLNSNLKLSDKLKAKPNFKHRTIYTEQLAAIHMKKIKIKFNKPIYVAMCILNISTELMSDFHYNAMKHIYGYNISICYMDTNSLTYELKMMSFIKV